MSEFSTSACLMWPVTTPTGTEGVGGADPHVTVLYLGDSENLHVKPMYVFLALQDLVNSPGEITVAGTEIFGDDDDQVWVAVLDDSELGRIQSQIKGILLEDLGIKDESSYPIYRPHVTLAPYVEGSEPPIVPESFALGDLEVWIGDEHFYAIR